MKRPGTELDAEIAVKVFNLPLGQACIDSDSRDNDGYFECMGCGYSTEDWGLTAHNVTARRYSTSIAEALKIRAHLKMGLTLSMGEATTRAVFNSNSDNTRYIAYSEEDLHHAPHAVCLAALQVIE